MIGLGVMSYTRVHTYVLYVCIHTYICTYNSCVSCTDGWRETLNEWRCVWEDRFVGFHYINYSIAPSSATPGRLNDLVSNGYLDLRTVSFLVS